MENYELISEFLDGNLQSAEEQELFAQLNADEELRSELKQQLAFKTAIRSDVLAYTPAPEATLGVLSALGMIPAAPIAAAIAEPSKFTLFLNAVKSSLIPGMMSAAAALTILSFALDKKQEAIQDIAANSFSGSGTPVVISYEKDASGSIVTKQELPKIIYRDKIIYIEKEAQAAVDLDNSPTSAVMNSPFVIEKKSELSKIEPFSQNPIIANTIINVQNSSKKPATGLSLEVKGFQALSNDLKKKTATEVQSFNNLNVALYYALFDKLGLNSLKNIETGIEYRRENIFQSFIYYDEIQKQFYKIEQQPNLQSLGLALRWLPDFAKIGNLQPLAQVFAGGNKVGAVLRGSLGLKYQFSNNYSLVGGFDYSYYNYYIHDFSGMKQSFWTNKYGLNFGLNIKF